MLTLADIFRAAGPAYVEAHAGWLLPSHRRAIDDIIACRNRQCPTCQEDRAQDWLARVRARLLPCDHDLLTFTLPSELRALAR